MLKYVTSNPHLGTQNKSLEELIANAIVHTHKDINSISEILCDSTGFDIETCDIFAMIIWCVARQLQNKSEEDFNGMG